MNLCQVLRSAALAASTAFVVAAVPLTVQVRMEPPDVDRSLDAARFQFQRLVWRYGESGYGEPVYGTPFSGTPLAPPVPGAPGAPLAPLATPAGGSLPPATLLGQLAAASAGQLAADLAAAEQRRRWRELGWQVSRTASRTALGTAQRSAEPARTAPAPATAAPAPEPRTGRAAGPATAPQAPGAAGAPAPAPGAPAAVRYAYAQLGKPYQYGAAGPGAFDCSGLTLAAWRTAGVSLPHSAAAQYSATRRVGRGELRAGDLVFYYPGITHVGIYAGNGMVIDAPQPGRGVTLRRVDSMPAVGYGRPASR